MKQIKEAQFIQACEKLQRDLLRKPTCCMYPGCKNTAINSHVLQEQKILKSIAPKNHLYCFGENSLFNKEQRVSYKRTGIRTVLSFWGFCEDHDDQIFSYIEKKDVDWSDPKSQFLLGYRSLCRELYIKQRGFDYYKALMDTFSLSVNSSDYCNNSILGYSMGIQDLNYYKQFLEMGIFKNDYSAYDFKTFVLPFYIELCVSSPISISYSEDIPNKDIANADFVETNIVNVFPYKNKTIVIIGFANGFINQWAKEFSEQINSSNIDVICKALNDLILFRSDFHCMSESLHGTIDSNVMKEFLKVSDCSSILLSNMNILNCT